MNTSLKDLTSQATVAIVDEDHRLLGSGFLVAPNAVLTSAHVLDNARGSRLFVQSHDGRLVGCRIWEQIPSTMTPGLDSYPLPDIGLLRLDHVFEDLPCVLLGNAEKSGDVIAFGHSAAVDMRQRYSPDLATLEVEGTRTEQGVDIIKLKGGIVDPGMSGGAILDPVAGVVIAITKAARTLGAPHGCYGVSSREIQKLLPHVWAESAMFHRKNRRWLVATSFENPDDSVVAAHLIAQVTSEVADRRTLGLPPDADKDRLHQDAWVRRLAASQQFTGSAGDRFRWESQRRLPLLTVLTGRAGLGKSWLMAAQGLRTAKLLAACQTPEEVGACRIPILADCTTLAKIRVDQEATVEDVAGQLLLAASPSLTDSPQRGVCMDLTRQACSSGLLEVVLDGLDELPISLRDEFERLLVRILDRGNRVVISGRPNSDSVLDGIKVTDREDLELLEFQLPQITDFVLAWHWEDPLLASAIINAVTKDQEIARLASTPLLLSFLCRVFDNSYSSKGHYPSTTELCAKVAMRILSGRDRRRPLSSHPQSLHGAPEPNIRLSLLAQGLGTMMDHWRGITEVFSRGELLSSLRGLPDFAAVEISARNRFAAIHGHLGSESGTPSNADFVIWEYLYDGILAESAGEDSQRTLRVLHPVLREYILATYFAGLSLERQKASLDTHKWFDPDWRKVIIVAAEISQDSDALVRSLLGFEGERNDLWASQRYFAAQLSVASDSEDARLSDSLLPSLVEALKSPIAFERRQVLEVLTYLVRSRVKTAVSWAEYVTAEASTAGVWTPIQFAVAAALVEGGVPQSTRLARQLSGTQDLPLQIRSQLVSSLVASSSPDAVEAAIELLTASAETDVLRAFLSAMKPWNIAAIAYAEQLLRNPSMKVSAYRNVSGSLADMGDVGLTVLRRILDDKLTTLQARLCACSSIIRSGDVSVVQRGLDLASNANVPVADKALLVASLLEANVEDAIAHGAALAVNERVPGHIRRRITDALAHLGQVGVTLLVRQLNSDAVALPLKTRHLSSLIELNVPDAIDFATRLHLSPQDPELRIFAAELLAPRHRNLVNEAVLVSLLDDPAMRENARRMLLRLLLTLGGATADAATNLLVREGSIEVGGGVELSLWSHRAAAKTLEKVARETSIDPSVRCEAVLALAHIPARQLRRLIDDTHASLPARWKARIYLGLGRRGYAPDLGAFLDTAVLHTGGYQLIYEFLSRSALSRDDMLRGLVAAAGAKKAAEESKVEAVAHGNKIGFSRETLMELGVSSESDDEVKRQIEWLYSQLEQLVGARMSRLLLPEQITEFEELIGKGDGEAADWLNVEILDVKDLVMETLDEVFAAVKTGRMVVPRFKQNDPAPLHVVAQLSSRLNVLVDLAKKAQWGEWWAMVQEFDNTLGYELVRRLLLIGASMDKTTFVHEAHLYVSSLVAAGGIVQVGERLQNDEIVTDDCRGALDRGDYRTAYRAALFGTLLTPDEASSWFYLALASIKEIDSHEFHVRMFARAGELASPNQRRDGSKTLRDMQPHLEITSSQLAAFLAALNEPTIQVSVD